MKITRCQDGETTILAFAGTLDAVTAPEARPVIEETLTDGSREIIMDMNQLNLIDSSGVGVIIDLFKRARANGVQCKVTGVRDQPRAIFRLLRLDRVFEIA